MQQHQTNTNQIAEAPETREVCKVIKYACFLRDKYLFVPNNPVRTEFILSPIEE
jgi:hypothetical protein